MSIGKAYRLARLLKGRENYFIIPIDHGLTLGPISSLADVKSFINSLPQQTISGIVAHKGLVNSIYPFLIQKDISLILHLSGSTDLSPDSADKSLVTSVEQAIKLNADAVSIHVNLGAKEESKMLKDFGLVADECDKWGMPLLAMIYSRGDKIKNEYDPEVIAHSTRVAWELGADIVKVNYTGNIQSFAKVVNTVNIPVVVAGGPKMDSDDTLLSVVKDSIRARGKGVAFGRNIFQHSEPHLIAQRVGVILKQSFQFKMQEVA